MMAAAAILAAGASSPAAPTPSLQEGRVLAIAGDKTITSYDVQQAAARMLPQLEQQFPREEDLQAAYRKLQSEILERMINEELVYLDFVALKGKIPPKYLQERIDRIVYEQANGNEELFREMLHRDNMTWKEFKDRILRQLAAEMLTYDRTRRNLTVPDAQIRDYFASHRADFDEPYSYLVQVIMLRKDGKYADDLPGTIARIRQEYAGGADFGQLAKRYSEGMNAENGGSLGWQTALAPKLQPVAERLSPGELYGQELDMGSIYLVRLADRRGGQANELTPEIAAKIRRILEEREAAQRYDEYIRKLYQKYPVRRFDRN